jgi:hypothetical protein
MMAVKRLARVAFGLALGAALSGCASRAVEHFYTVSSGDAAPAAGAEVQQVAVSPVVIPALIDRPQLVVRTSTHEVAVLENHRWGEPLSVDLTRALIDDLRRARPGFSIATADTPQTRGAGQVLDVAITELLSGPGTTASLQASWVLRDRHGNCVRVGNLESSIPAQAGYGAIPVAYADAMSRLADAIARTIAAVCE